MGNSCCGARPKEDNSPNVYPHVYGFEYFQDSEPWQQVGVGARPKEDASPAPCLDKVTSPQQTAEENHEEKRRMVEEWRRKSCHLRGCMAPRNQARHVEAQLKWRNEALVQQIMAMNLKPKSGCCRNFNAWTLQGEVLRFPSFALPLLDDFSDVGEFWVYRAVCRASFVDLEVLAETFFQSTGNERRGVLQLCCDVSLGWEIEQPQRWKAQRLMCVARCAEALCQRNPGLVKQFAAELQPYQQSSEWKVSIAATAFCKRLSLEWGWSGARWEWTRCKFFTVR